MPNESIPTPTARPKGRTINGPALKRPMPRTARSEPDAQLSEEGAREIKQIRRPRSRPLHTSGFEPRIVNGRPDRKYILASEVSGLQTPQFYESLGYRRVEDQGEDGPRFAFGPTTGISGGVEFYGHVLMEIPVEDWEAIEEYGTFGNTGQRHITDIERRIIDHAKNPDRSRGIHHNPYIQLEGDSGTPKEQSIALMGEAEESEEAQ